MGAQGTVSLDFGAFPGASDASVAVTGQAGILGGSLVEAWILPAATADHSADEHIAEELMVFAGNVVGGTGFTIYGVHRPAVNEPIEPWGPVAAGGGQGTRLYGVFNIAWAWN
jgi:hypothetical protein